jgi:hypothetical protein
MGTLLNKWTSYYKHICHPCTSKNEELHNSQPINAKGKVFSALHRKDPMQHLLSTMADLPAHNSHLCRQMPATNGIGCGKLVQCHVDSV